MASVTFLGTAGGNAVSRQSRASGGIIIVVDDVQLHLDPGPGSLVKAKEFGVNTSNTTAILVSHNHISHCNDVNALIEAMTHSGIEHRGIVLASKSVLQQTDLSFPVVTKYHMGLVEKVIALEKNHKVGIDNVEIHALPVQHTDPTAIGFKIICPKFTIGYSGDTAFSSEFVESLMGVDLLILNVTYPGKRAQGMNLDTDSAMKIISTVRPKMAIITHFGTDMLKLDPITEAREIQRITGVQTIAAHDGLTISPAGYQQNQSPIRGYN